MNLKTCLSPLVIIAAILSLSMAATVPLLRSDGARHTDITHPTENPLSQGFYNEIPYNNQNHMRENIIDAVLDDNLPYNEVRSILQSEQESGGFVDFERNILKILPNDKVHKESLHKDKMVDLSKLNDLRMPNLYSKSPLIYKISEENKFTRPSDSDIQNAKSDVALNAEYDIKKQEQRVSEEKNVRSSRSRRDIGKDAIEKHRAKMIAEEKTRLKEMRREERMRLVMIKKGLNRAGQKMTESELKREEKIYDIAYGQMQSCLYRIERLKTTSDKIIWADLQTDEEMQHEMMMTEIKMDEENSAKLFERLKEIRERKEKGL